MKHQKPDLPTVVEDAVVSSGTTAMAQPGRYSIDDIWADAAQLQNAIADDLTVIVRKLPRGHYRFQVERLGTRTEVLPPHPTEVQSDPNDIPF